MSFTPGSVCQTEYKGGHLSSARRRGAVRVVGTDVIVTHGGIVTRQRAR